MAWSNDPISHRDPLLQLGWELVGLMVRDRREWLGWSQRDLARRSGTSQPVISRLENGRLRGLKFQRFAAMVAVMGGLKRDAPQPPRRTVEPELHEPIRLDYGPPDSMIRQWMPNRDGGSYTHTDRRPSPYTIAPENPREDPTDQPDPPDPPDPPDWPAWPGRRSSRRRGVRAPLDSTAVRPARGLPG